jgi:hypothetical protein
MVFGATYRNRYINRGKNAFRKEVASAWAAMLRGELLSCRAHRLTSELVNYHLSVQQEPRRALVAGIHPLSTHIRQA